MSPKFRYIGITDECVACEQCGKPNLKSTVVLAILDEDGTEESIVYFGSSCAAKALSVKGGGAAVLKAARYAHERLVEEVRFARRQLMFYGLPYEGEPTSAMVHTAVELYRDAHRDAVWAPGTSAGTWTGYVQDMLQRQQAKIAEGKVVGL